MATEGNVNEATIVELYQEPGRNRCARGLTRLAEHPRETIRNNSATESRL